MSSTTESVESVQSLEVAVELETVLSALKEFDCADLFKVIKTATLEAEKRVKSGSKIVAKKAGSAPKGVQPPQLRKPREWVEFTLKHALENGWEKFVAVKGKEEIEYAASVEYEGAHVFPDSWSEKFPAGKQLIMAQAMSLSKQRWTPKTKNGTHEALYKEFSDAFDAAEPVAEAAAPVVAAPVVRKSAAEKEAEIAQKKAAKEAEKAAAKAVKEAEKETAKALKEAEKAEAKRVKDLEKEAAKASKGKIPAAAIKAAAKSPVKTVVVKAAAKKPVAVKPVAWTCPADGGVHPWVSNGVKYLRNSNNQVWLDGGDEVGDWQGVYDEATGKIDDAVEEPSFDDE
jgi:hypothetical protein